MIETDVCIIGAGPAGTTTSLFLSKFKIPHVIVDAATFPRDKTCGDGLDLKVMRVLNNLESGMVEREVLTNENFTQTKGVIIHVSEKEKATFVYEPKNDEPDLPFFCYCKRQYFDNFLVKKIKPQYATFLQGTKVEEIVVEEGNYRKIIAKNSSGKIEIRTKLMVGADGDHSIVLRSLGIRDIDREHYAGALRQYWKGISYEQTGNYLEMYFPKYLPMGYFWIFPLPNGEANVGCGFASSLLTKQKVNIKNLLNDIITKDPVMKERFKNAQPLEKPVGWGLPLSSLKRKAAGDGWLLVGDAASLIYPTTGEGIGPGMMSGYIAAHFIQRAVQTNNFSATTFKNYDREIYKRWEMGVKVFKWAKNISPTIYNIAFKILQTKIFNNLFFKPHAHKWIKTGYEEKIGVEID